MRIVLLDANLEPLLFPTITWNGVFGDLALNGADHPTNPGDLRTGQSLATAVLICLMTDIRVDPSELPDGEENRGWPGDGFNMEPGDVPLGSKLWLLRRRALTEDIEQRAEDYAREALQTLIDQGAVVRWDISTTANRPQNRLDIAVTGYGRDGRSAFDQRYGVLWDQLAGQSRPLDP